MLKKKLIGIAVAAAVAPAAWATNGMNMEGYGPVATGMGGTSYAYDNGTAAAINNPATLGLMTPGAARFDLAIGGLHPDIRTSASNGAALDSGGNAYYMPAIGYARKDGALAWGVAMMAQGGMGTEYSDGSFWGTLIGTSAGASDPALMAQGQARQNRSEVGVGRVMFPLAYNATKDLTIGGSIDFVWASMDVKWLIDGAHFGDMMAGQSQTFGTVTGSLIGDTTGGTTGLVGAMNAGMVTGVSWGYFDFSNSSKFTGKAMGTGWAGKLGMTYQATPDLSFGAVYQAKTHISDMTTDSGGATITFQGTGVAFGGGAIPVSGKVKVRNFQWPETYGFGLAYRASDRWLIAADYKRLNWADVMKNFNLTFEADGTQANPAAAGFAGLSMDMSFRQNWKNQNVYMIGAAYKATDAWTVRFGANLADNPIPDQYVSPLFPATIKDHYMVGAGYVVSKASSLNASFTYAPKVTVTNSWGSMLAGSNQTISHSQTNWQLMYSYRY